MFCSPLGLPSASPAYARCARGVASAGATSLHCRTGNRTGCGHGFDARLALADVSSRADGNRCAWNVMKNKLA